MSNTPTSIPLTDLSERFVAYEYDKVITGGMRHMVGDSVTGHKVWMTNTNDQPGQPMAIKVARALNLLHRTCPDAK